MSNLAITDLRINNYIICKELQTPLQIATIKGILQKELIIEYGYENIYGQVDINGFFTKYNKISGIPLTKEWLYKLGFYKVWNGCYQHSDINPRLEISDYGLQFYYIDDAESTLEPVNMLHQLQNQVYFAFGIELTIKGE